MFLRSTFDKRLTIGKENTGWMVWATINTFGLYSYPVANQGG
jgi:hypothetical protein